MGNILCLCRPTSKSENYFFILYKKVNFRKGAFIVCSGKNVSTNSQQYDIELLINQEMSSRQDNRQDKIQGYQKKPTRLLSYGKCRNKQLTRKTEHLLETNSWLK